MILSSSSASKIKVVSNSLNSLASEKIYLENSLFFQNIITEKSVKLIYDLVYKAYFSWAFSLFFINKIGGKSVFINMVNRSRDHVFITTIDSLGGDCGYNYCLYNGNFKYLKFLYEQLSLGNLEAIDQLVEEVRFSDNGCSKINDLLFKPIYIFHDIHLLMLQTEEVLIVEDVINRSTNIFEKLFVRTVNYNVNPLEARISKEISKFSVH